VRHVRLIRRNASSNGGIRPPPHQRSRAARATECRLRCAPCHDKYPSRCPVLRPAPGPGTARPRPKGSTRGHVRSPVAPRVRRPRVRKASCGGSQRRPRPGCSLPGRRSRTRAATVPARAAAASGEPSRAAPSRRRRSGRRSCTAPHRRCGTCSDARVPLVPRRRPRPPPRWRTSTEASGNPAFIPGVWTNSIAHPADWRSSARRPVPRRAGSAVCRYMSSGTVIVLIVSLTGPSARRPSLPGARSGTPLRRSIRHGDRCRSSRWPCKMSSSAATAVRPGWATWSAGSSAAGPPRSSFPARSM
jgi:hypothetical protein